MPLNRDRARQIMVKAEVDAIVAASPANVYYVSDYHSVGIQLGCGTQSYALLPIDGEPAIVAPLSEADLVYESGSWVKDVHFYGCPNLKAVIKGGTSEITKLIAEANSGEVQKTSCDALVIATAARGLADKTLAVDTSGVTPTRFENIKRNLPDAKIVEGRELLEKIRAVKIEEEVSRIGRVTEITEKAMEDALEIAQPGIMEIDLSGMYSYSITEDGGRITHNYIGFGERSAYPNPIPTMLQSKKGDLIRMSLGAVLQYYNSNVSRTAILGKASLEIEKRLKAVIDAQESAFDVVRPGAKVSEVYAAAHGELEKAGLKECSPSLGHSIGVECNERPLVTSSDDTSIEEGMVFTIDVPYLDLGLGGLELEDTLVVTKKGFRLLTNTERTLYLL